MSSFFSERKALPALLTVSAESDHGGARLEDEIVGLFEQFRSPLLRYLSSFGLVFADGEEVIQDVFLALFQHLRAGRSRENLRGWLFRVAHNLALRRRNRNRRDWESRADAAAGEVAIDPGPNPEDQLRQNQTQVRLLAVVQALPEQDRQCLALRAEGLRYREIAEILDMSLGAVSLSVARSLSRMACVSER
ncbi:MAG: sigma-70 family RNA polymerase sigma factor [Bryobacteraceae bacterium]